MAEYQFIDRPLKQDPHVESPPPIRQPWRSASIYCDHGGCGFYRSLFVSQEITQLTPLAIFAESQSMLVCDAFYASCRSLRLQRMISPEALRFFQNYLLPLRRKNHFRILFDLDDILVMEDIPQYNIYREVFRNSSQTLPFFLENSDLVTVSTPQLQDYYSGRFGVPRDHFVVLPNFTPQFWADRYCQADVANRVQRHAGRKKRIGFSCNCSHFNLQPNAKLQDDFSSLNEWIIANRKKYQFVFQGGFPGALLPFQADFEIYPAIPVLHFLSERQKLDLDLLIQPLENNLFNRAKSIIKFYEAWATGIPILVSDLPNFQAAAPECCFHDVADMESKIGELFASSDAYCRTVENNYRKMSQLWLHLHLTPWMQIMSNNNF